MRTKINSFYYVLVLWRCQIILRFILRKKKRTKLRKNLRSPCFWFNSMINLLPPIYRWYFSVLHRFQKTFLFYAVVSGNLLSFKKLIKKNCDFNGIIFDKNWSLFFRLWDFLLVFFVIIFTELWAMYNKEK